jgi:hypothetical protein
VTLVGSATNTTSATQRISMGISWPTTVNYGEPWAATGATPATRAT